MKSIGIVIVLAGMIVGCGQREVWSCVIDGDTMYSMSNKGNLGGAQKGCTCDEIRQFELTLFGEVDEEAMERDFGCKSK